MERIFYNFQHRLTQQQLNLIKFLAINRWYGEFNQDRTSFQDAFREGHLKTVVFPENIYAMQQWILQDRPDLT